MESNKLDYSMAHDLILWFAQAQDLRVLTLSLVGWFEHNWIIWKAITPGSQSRGRTWCANPLPNRRMRIHERNGRFDCCFCELFYSFLSVVLEYLRLTDSGGFLNPNSAVHQLLPVDRTWSDSPVCLLHKLVGFLIPKQFSACSPYVACLETSQSIVTSFYHMLRSCLLPV